MDCYKIQCLSFFHCLLDKTLKEWNPINLNKTQLFLEIEPSVINEKDAYGDTPLHRVLSSDNCSIDMVRLLVNNGADVNYEDYEHDVSSLMAAFCHKRDYAVIRILIERGADVKAIDAFGSTSLCHALGNGYSIEVIKLLLEEGCHPNACLRHSTALECAAENPAEGELRKEGVLDLLIEAGANVLRFGINGESPVCCALRAGAELGDIQRLLGLGASLDACQKHPSFWLCATDFRTEARQMMLVHSKVWGMPLKADVFELLGTASAPINSVNEDGYTPLQLALFCCDYQTRAIKLLIDLPGVDFSVKAENNQNLLHLAVKNPHCKPSAVKFLIERGAKVDELNIMRQTPLCVAMYKCSFSSFGIAKLLLRSGSPVNGKDVIGVAPLNLAVMFHGFDTIQQLLFHGARIKRKKDPEDWLLLDALDHFLRSKSQFSNQKKLEILKLLLKHYFLEDPDYEVHRLISRCSKLGSTLIEELMSFAIKCANEVQIMKSNYIDINRTLLFFVTSRLFATPTAAINSPSLSCNEFDRLLNIMVDYDLSQFFEIISIAVGRSTMETNLQKLRVYAIKNYPDFIYMTEKTYLDYDSLFEITQLLSAADLLRLILVYTLEKHKQDIEGSPE